MKKTLILSALLAAVVAMPAMASDYYSYDSDGASNEGGQYYDGTRAVYRTRRVKINVARPVQKVSAPVKQYVSPCAVPAAPAMPAAIIPTYRETITHYAVYQPVVQYVNVGETAVRNVQRVSCTSGCK